MPDSQDNNDQHEHQLDALIAEYYRAEAAGKAPDHNQFIAQHPEFAKELAEFFADVLMLHGPERQNPHDPALEPTITPNTSPRSKAAVGSVVRYFGEYEILEELGAGGMGVVYKARQTKLKRIVALKMIRSGTLANSQDVQRFEAEAKAAAKLTHPGIVSVHEVGIHNGQPFYTMDYVEGGSLSRLHRDKPVASKYAAKLVRRLAESMHYAHQQNIIHRDLKPANILLTGKGAPRITDFGLAKRLRTDDESHEPTMTESGQILGTAGYMSPEQAAGGAAGVFGFGSGGGGDCRPFNFKLWDVSTAEELMKVIEVFGGFAFSPDSKALLICDGMEVQIRDISTGDNLATLEHEGVWWANYIRNGELLVTYANASGSLTTASPETRIKFWNTETWEETETGIDPIQTFWTAPVFSGDGQTMAAFAADDFTKIPLRIWNIDSGQEEPTPNIAKAAVSIGFRFAPDPPTLLIPIDESVDNNVSDMRIVYWDLSAGKEKIARNFLWPSIQLFHFHFPRKAIAGDNPTAVSVELIDDTFKVRDWKTEEVIHEFPNPTSWMSTPVNSVPTDEFPDGTGCHPAGDQLLMLYTGAEPEGFAEPWMLDEIRNDRAREPSRLEIVNLKTGQRVTDLTDVAFLANSPNCEFMVTRDMQTGNSVLAKTIGGIELARLPNCFFPPPQFSPDSTVLAMSRHGVIELWNVADFQKGE